MGAKSELKGRISLDNKEFLSKLRESIGMARNFSNDVAIGMLKATGATWAFNKAVSELEGTWEKLKKAFNLGSELEQVSRRTGMLVGSLYQVRAAALRSGVEFESVGGSINKMQKAISGVNELGRNVSGAFDDLGLSLEELRRMSPEEQFQVIGTAIGSLKNPVDQASAAMDIFGKSGAELLKIFNNPNVHLDLGKPLTGVAKIMQTYGASMDAVNMGLKRIGTVIDGFYRGIAGPVSTVLLPLLNRINSMDLSGYGLKFGQSIAMGVRALYNAFEGGRLPELMRLSVKVAFQQAGNTLFTMLPRLGKAMSDLMGSDMWSHLSNVFDGIALNFGAALLDAVAKPVLYLQGAIAYQAFKRTMGDEVGGAQIKKDHANSQLTDAINARDAYRNKTDTYSYTGMFGQHVQHNSEEPVDPKKKKQLDDAVTAATNGARSADNFFDAMKKSSKQSMSDFMDQYSKENSPSFFGKSPDAMRGKGNRMIEEGTTGISNIGKELAKKLMADLNPSKNQQRFENQTPFGDDSKKLGRLFKSLQRPIPGEGTTEPGELPPEPGEDEIFNTKKKQFKLERMHRGLNGMTNLGGRSHFGVNETGAPGTLGGGVIGIAGVHRTPSLADAQKAKDAKDAKDHTKLLQAVKENTGQIAKSIKMAIAG